MVTNRHEQLLVSGENMKCSSTLKTLKCLLVSQVSDLFDCGPATAIPVSPTTPTSHLRFLRPLPVRFSGLQIFLVHYFARVYQNLVHQ